jgi:hypothetical protein
MVSELLATKVLGIFPSMAWYTVLVLLCIALIVMYVKYRKAMKP